MIFFVLHSSLHVIWKLEQALVGFIIIKQFLLDQQWPGGSLLFDFDGQESLWLLQVGFEDCSQKFIRLHIFSLANSIYIKGVFGDPNWIIKCTFRFYQPATASIFVFWVIHFKILVGKKKTHGIAYETCNCN